MADKPKTEKWKAARTKNLSAGQMQQAVRIVGQRKAGAPVRTERVTAKERKASQDFVNIGTTKWLTASERGGKGRGGLLVDQSGNPVTGTVKLPSGQSATYVRGKRIGVVRAGGSSAGEDKTKNPPPKTTGPRGMSMRSAELMRKDRNASRTSGTILSGRPVSAQQVSAAARKRAQERKKQTYWDPVAGKWIMPGRK